MIVAEATMNKGSPPSRGSRSADRVLEELELGYREDRRSFRWALLAALFVHAALLVITFPELAAKPRDFRRPARLLQVQHVRFRPPPPKPQGRQQIQKPKKRRIPIPDPTPDDPEPILVPEVTLPEIDLPEIDDGVFLAIPDAPPGAGAGAAGGNRTPLQVGGEVEPPVAIHTPRPRYTDEARQARLQGTVLLQAIIDETGNVTGLETLKGLPLGLTESALETVRGWKYEPATLAGEPVPVYFHLMVRFSLQ